MAEMKYLAQLEFYKLDDVNLTACEIMFAIYQLNGASGIPSSLLGQSVKYRRRSDQPTLPRQGANVARDSSQDPNLWITSTMPIQRSLHECKTISATGKPCATNRMAVVCVQRVIL